MEETREQNPIYKPEGTSLTYLWPLGATFAMRKSILNTAYLIHPDRNGRNVVRWLTKNAWKLLK